MRVHRSLGTVFTVLFLLTIHVSVTHAADVYYFGNATAETSQTNEKYSFKKRLTDLLDLTSGRPMAERSGRISGSVLTQVDYAQVSGNDAKSFLTDGVDYLSEVNLNLQEKLWRNYNLQGQVMLRKTDNPRIEPRRDVRVKEYSLKVANPENLLLFGDFYGELSPFTLSNTLEGLTAEIQPSDRFNMKYIAARQYDADEAAGKYQRNVYGVKLDTFLFMRSAIISNARVGVQAVTTQDDSSTLSSASTLQDLRNSVFSIDGDLSFTKGFSMNYEFARSFYLEDEDAADVKDQSSGNSFHVAPQMQWRDTVVRHVYNYTQPDFYTESGSASPDKIQHLTTVDHRVNQQVSLSLMHNYYWDHLTNSDLTKRTINDEKTVSMNIMPLTSRKTFRTRVHTSFNTRDSDDRANSAESQTLTMGFAVNDRWHEADVGFSYEYRAFTSEADDSQNDYFNRLGFNFSREYELFTRRLYLTLAPSVDIRRTKRDPNQDVNVNVSFSGQYDVSEDFLSRFGHNLVDSDNAGPDKDYMNNRSYMELDWALGKEKNTHVVLRGDVNRYMHEDGTLNYKEIQTVLKCILAF
jgi:hypothetical protein